MDYQLEDVKFYFPDNYKDIINDSSLVNDFDTFIGMAVNGKLELSKSNILSNNSAKYVNENISRKIPMNMKRPNLKSYPNALGLFLLFSLSGIGKKELKGKKRVLTVNLDIFEQWKQFSDIDKYFYLFSLIFTKLSLEPINEDRDLIFEFNIIQKRLAKTKNKWVPNKHEKELFLDTYRYKTIFILLNMLGLIDIEDSPLKENQGWDIVSIKQKEFMPKLWESTSELVSLSMFPASLDESENEEDNQEFTFDDVEGIGSVNRFADKISEQIPEFTKRLNFNLETKPGSYYFKISIGNAVRTIKIDYRDSLDALCSACLDAFNFDFDHLYDVTFNSTFGQKLTFNGAPDIEYAEYPTTEDITIGNLPIQVYDEMLLTFDYGDNWVFSIILKKIEPIENETEEPQLSKVIESIGEAPQQYPEWD